MGGGKREIGEACTLTGLYKARSGAQKEPAASFKHRTRVCKWKKLKLKHYAKGQMGKQLMFRSRMTATDLHDLLPPIMLKLWQCSGIKAQEADYRDQILG
jgi:hypothetical protein